MDDQNYRQETAKRRSILQLTAAAGGIGILPMVSAAGNPASESRESAIQSNQQVIGSFETGLDGWTTNGDNQLSRVSKSDMPTSVVEGKHSLQVEINDDLFPLIQNETRVQNADFVSYPFFSMHVLSMAEGSESALAFRFRLHHSSGSSTKDGSGDKPLPVEESELKLVPQLRSRRVGWDMSDLPDDVLASAQKLEIAWYLEDRGPITGPPGRSDGDYNGIAVFDDIHLSNSQTADAPKQLHDKKMNLHTKHGMIVNRVIDEQTEKLETGTYEFADGSVVPYELKILADGSIEYTIDGDQIGFGGGQ